MNYLPKTPKEYLQVFVKQRKLFFIPFASLLAATAIVYTLLPRYYESSSIILIDSENILNPLVKDLAVHQNFDKRFAALTKQILSWTNITQLVKRLDLDDKVDSQVDFERLINDIRGRILITTVEKGLVSITFEDKNPQMAKTVANSLVKTLWEVNKQIQDEQSDRAIKFIDEQLRIYGEKLGQSERSFLVSSINSQLEDALRRRRLLSVQLETFQKQQNAAQVRQLNPAVSSMEAEIAASEARLQQMLLDYKKEHPSMTELRERIDLLKQQLAAEQEKSQEAEIPVVSNPAYEKALAEANELDIQISTMRRRMGDLQSGSTSQPRASEQELLGMERDKRVNEDIYQALLRRLENAYITQRMDDLESVGKLTIVEEARLPLTPSRPCPGKIAGMGFLLALMAGAGFVLGKEYFDASLRNVEDAKEFLDLTHLGSIPKMVVAQASESLEDWKAAPSVLILPSANPKGPEPKAKDVFIAKRRRDPMIQPEVVTYHDPHSIPAEQYRLLSTQIFYAAKKHPIKSLLITSATEAEGKTTTSINLAVTMAEELRGRVLVVDADLRKGELAHYLAQPSKPGLSDILRNRCDFEQAIVPTKIPGISILPSGDHGGNAVELLSAPNMASLVQSLKSRYDMVIFDSPPALYLADVPVLCHYADGILLVVQLNKAPRELVANAASVIKQGGPVLGYVLTHTQYFVPEYVNRYFSKQKATV